MELTTIFQTLEDRENPDEVEQKGPFMCHDNHAWLGRGYYFWDSHIQLGHWWGNMAWSGNYMIVRSYISLDKSCWDLHGKGAHREEFLAICDEMIRAKISSKEKLRVWKVVEFFKKKGKMAYKAIRACGTGSVGNHVDYLMYRVKFKTGNPAYLDLYPPVQICLFEQRALSLHGYSVVYPEDYAEVYG